MAELRQLEPEPAYLCSVCGHTERAGPYAPPFVPVDEDCGGRCAFSMVWLVPGQASYAPEEGGSEEGQ